jgi:hypothetical protein
MRKREGYGPNSPFGRSCGAQKAAALGLMEPADVVLTPSFASLSRELVVPGCGVIVFRQPATAKLIEEPDIIVT